MGRICVADLSADCGCHTSLCVRGHGQRKGNEMKELIYFSKFTMQFHSYILVIKCSIANRLHKTLYDQIQAAADVDALSDVAGMVQGLSVEDDGDERQGDVSDTVEEEADPSVVASHDVLFRTCLLPPPRRLCFSRRLFVCLSV